MLLLVVMPLIAGCGADGDGGEIDLEEEVSAYVEDQTDREVTEISCQPDADRAGCEVMLEDGTLVNCGASSVDEHVEVSCIE